MEISQEHMHARIATGQFDETRCLQKNTTAQSRLNMKRQYTPVLEGVRHMRHDATTVSAFEAWPTTCTTSSEH
jgi:hypothetical protein